MLTAEQFEKAQQFIYRHGDLLTRRRFAYHFEQGSKETVLDALACYQNEDGGFGNGLEQDILCPDSSGICTEVAFGTLVELDVNEGTLFERGLHWVETARTKDGDLPHPLSVKQYPHGPWWAEDHGRILSIAGLLGKMGRCSAEINRRAAAVFERTYVPFPEELPVYAYPAALYLRHGDLEGRHRRFLPALEAAFMKMLQVDGWHHPLFFCHDRWNHAGIPAALWQSEAEKAVATLQEDGGVDIERYTDLPWWRPIWTVDMLVILKRREMLGDDQADKNQ